MKYLNCPNGNWKMNNMKKKAADQKGANKDIVVKTNLTFDELLKKALNTPPPKKENKSKKKKEK